VARVVWNYGAPGVKDKIRVRPRGNFGSAGELSNQGMASRGDICEASDDGLRDVRWVKDGMALERGHTGNGPWPMRIKGALTMVML